MPQQLVWGYHLSYRLRLSSTTFDPGFSLFVLQHADRWSEWEHYSCLFEACDGSTNLTIPSEIYCCFTVLARKVGQEGSDKNCHPVFRITSGFYSRGQRINKRILPTSEYIHSKDIFRVFLIATRAECKQRGPRAESMRLRAGITRFCLYEAGWSLWSIGHRAPARLTDKWGSEDLKRCTGKALPGGGKGSPLQYPCLERIPWTEEPGGLQSTGSQRVRHDWSDWACAGRVLYSQIRVKVLLGGLNEKTM